METITITPTIATQRLIATLLLKSKLNDGMTLSHEAFDWAVKILEMEYDCNSHEYLCEMLETFDLIKNRVTEIARELLWSIADNGFLPLTQPPAHIESKFRFLHELVKANPDCLHKTEEIQRLISEEVGRLARDENFIWAFTNEDSDCPVKREHAKQILNEEKAFSRIMNG